MSFLALYYTVGTTLPFSKNIILFPTHNNKHSLNVNFDSGTPTGRLDKLESLLSWNVAVHKVPWGLLLLLGGGFSMAYASEVLTHLV